MRRLLLILTFTLALLVCFATRPSVGQPPAAEAADPSDSAEVVQEDAAPATQPRPARKDVPIEDLAADTATHGEIEPLAVAFKRLSAFRLRDDGCLVACDGEARAIKLIDSGKLTGPTPVKSACPLGASIP